MHRSIPRPSATIIASLALSTFAATGGIVAAGSPTAVQPTTDRAALEALLAERPVDTDRRVEALRADGPADILGAAAGRHQ